MVRKLCLLFFAVGILLPGDAIKAQADKLAPEFNPLCWKRAECEKVRRDLNKEAKVGEGFIQNESPCVGGDPKDPWGQCLPANIATTQISFAGNNKFLNIGDFLLKNYKTAISLASVLASIMVVIAGFQWATSGGNADTISKAKHRIGGSIIGLFIAYTSYAILSTINPELVNLRLPQTMMLRPQSEMPKFCSSAPSSTTFAKVADKNDQKSPVDTSQAFKYDISYTTINNTLNCGDRFVANNGGSATCFGGGCSAGTVCSNFNIDNPQDDKYDCRRGSIAGEIVGNYYLEPVCVLKTGYEFPWVDKNTGMNSIFKVCKVGNVIRLENISPHPESRVEEGPNRNALFQISSISRSSLNTNCSQGQYLGYALSLELDASCTNPDIEHLVDKNGNDLGILGTNDGWELEEPAKSISERDLFTPDELVQGKRMYIDVSSFLQKRK